MVGPVIFLFCMVISVLTIQQGSVQDEFLTLFYMSIGPVLLFCASVGLGARVQHHKEEIPWDLSFILGLLLLGCILLPITAVGALHWSPLLCLPMLRWAWTLRKKIQWICNESLRWPIVLFGALLFWLASTQTVDTDSLYYHLSLPKHIWNQNQLLSGELRPNGSRPLLFHLPLAPLIGIFGLKAATAFSGILSTAFLFSVVSRSDAIRTGSGKVALLCLLGSYSFWEQSSITANNILAGFVVWLAYWESRSKNVGFLGLLIGLGVSVKFTSVGILGLIWIFANKNWMDKWKDAALALLVFSIWPMRNWMDSVAPLFPYAGWSLDIPFVYVEKYGLGRDWLSMLKLPWNVVMEAKTDGFQFLGRLSPLILGLLPIGIWEIRRHPLGYRLCATLMGGFVFWALGPHWIRHLFPMLGLLVFALSISVNWQNTWHRVGVLMLFTSGLSSNWLPFAQDRSANLFPETVTEKIPGFRAVTWINEHSEEEAKVALLFAWSGALLDRDYVLGSVEDHSPVRHWILTRGKHSLSALKAEGVDYLIVGPHRFLRRSYSFLSEESFQREFKDPLELLDGLLLKEARLITTLDGYSVYFLTK